MHTLNMIVRNQRHYLSNHKNALIDRLMAKIKLIKHIYSHVKRFTFCASEKKIEKKLFMALIEVKGNNQP